MSIAQALQFSVPEATDSYKITHHLIYPPGLTKLYSYLEARGCSEFADYTVFYGLQYFLKSFFVGECLTIRDLPRIKAFCKHHFYGVEGLFNEAGWLYIIEKHGGKLPVSIRAVAEGTVVPVGNVLMTIENTDPKCAWLVNFLETLLVEIWYPITIATLSRSIKQTIKKFLDETCDDALVPLLLPSRLHDFGFRGVSSYESAAIGGSAHLVNFAGTDTTAAIGLINQFYNGPDYAANKMYDNPWTGKPWSAEESYRRWDEFYSKNMPGNSIPATEHSQMTINGPSGEEEMCGRLLKEFPNGFVACVSDSYDPHKLCSEVWGGRLKDKVLNRNGTLVVRPDSGVPEIIVVEIMQILADKIGYYANSKGYKVLNDHVRIIQGDGVSYISIPKILQAVKDAGFSTENLAFGSGGALLQKVNRDTFAFAFKACYREIDGVGADVFKQPKTDSKKNSKRGKLALVEDNNGKLTTIRQEQAGINDLLIEVYRDGVLLIDQNFETIRKLAEV